jgi:hypothetical protein
VTMSDLAVLDGDSRDLSLPARFGMLVPTFTRADAWLYAHFADRCADACTAGVDTDFVLALEPFSDERMGQMFPLRLFAYIHQAVLAGELPELSAYYQTVGGDKPAIGAWSLFRDAVLERAALLPGRLGGQVEPRNEVARAAALSVGFLELARLHPGLPMRLLEVGAGAGLLGLWSETLSSSWYSRLFASPEDIPHHDVLPQIESRSGCDLMPVDVTTVEGYWLLRSYVWPDFPEHMRMLDAAITVQRRIRVRVAMADGADWLYVRLAELPKDTLTVVYHSAIREAAGLDAMRRISAAIHDAAGRQTARTPLAYLRLETEGLRSDAPLNCLLSLQSFGTEPQYRVLARADTNGRNVRLERPTEQP